MPVALWETVLKAGFSRLLVETKTMTQAFHLEADNIPVTFPGKCQGLGDLLGWQATQETRR